jgi:hypothetical protein
MPMNSFPPVVPMYSLYQFLSRGGYCLVTFKLRTPTLYHIGKYHSNLGYYPITNRLRHVTFVTHHSTFAICQNPPLAIESVSCRRPPNSRHLFERSHSPAWNNHLIRPNRLCQHSRYAARAGSLSCLPGASLRYT